VYLTELGKEHLAKLINQQAVLKCFVQLISSKQYWS